MKLDMSKIYKAVLKTEKGSITIEFDTANTPITSNNFISLAREGFYNGTVFHRTIDGFMIQGGDPEGTGRGGPGFQFDDEYLEGSYTRGVVAMANSGPNTNGSQFFIMHKDYNLPPAYVIFAKVIEGMEVVDAIATAEVTASFSGELSVPVNPVSVQSIEIIEE
ncbi:peptidylprolyl isomerase [Candidatus Woesebacteria bacterium RIFCSPHIGHO2_01_FULL_41_10]|uniref:Peptidyl-prolyl cis-trans isomerase n=1 Tax=Candidatus Woesebacteria bacterium RIFCSPHIGHO2_01_FULL_41_10 TaxID=1802500 RepID=A0A1F7YTJ3_9BACT|nr:MAG: peptidylprolyl isomerase [Candidatus Woesebacteria bacterium RIFCSPHIGHO2_01_FULL_41_10]